MICMFFDIVTFSTEECTPLLILMLLLDGLNCTWGSWTSFSSCSATCGDGMQYRERSLKDMGRENSRNWCTKKETDIQTCNIQPCKPGTYHLRNDILFCVQFSFMKIILAT